MQQAERECEIGARRHLQVQRRAPRSGRPPRVDHDQRAALVLAFGEPARERRHGVGGVAADKQHRARPADVREREGQPAVDTESADPGGSRRRHAETAVVVDLRGPERHPGELAEGVRLFIGQPTTAEDADGVRAVLFPDPAQLRRDPVERVVPGHRTQRRRAVLARQWRGEPLRGRQKLGGGPALLAQATAVGREVAGRDLDRSVRRAQQHPALQRAVRAVRRNARVRRRRCGHGSSLRPPCCVAVAGSVTRPVRSALLPTRNRVRRWSACSASQRRAIPSPTP